MHRCKSRRECAITRSLSIIVAAALCSFPLSAQAPAQLLTRFVVVIDAAHGGDDTGGRLASGRFEKDAALDFSVRLRSLLNARGIVVVTTRESDSNLLPERRAEIANHVHAQACLSLHASESGAGIHLFTSSLPVSQPTRFIAWKTAQSGWITRSLALAGALNSALQQTGANVTLSRTSLLGVDSMTCPAVAIELAPARGPDGAVTAEPDDADYQSRIAATLANAILEWRTEVRQP